MKKILLLFVLGIGLLSFSKVKTEVPMKDVVTTVCTITVYIDGEQGPSFNGLSIFDDEFGRAQACSRARDKMRKWLAANY
jgi:hypothetical protein